MSFDQRYISAATRPKANIKDNAFLIMSFAFFKKNSQKFNDNVRNTNYYLFILKTEVAGIRDLNYLGGQ